MSSRPPFPSSANIRSILRFSPERGQLTLGDERLLLFSQTAVSLLRRLMNDQLGPSMSRMLLTQFGYQHGMGDFETLKDMFSWESDAEQLAAGPLMHAWSGIVQVEPLQMEMDRASGHFHFRGLWHHSYEAEIYKNWFGLSDEPVCYSLVGYGTGWCSAFFGSPVLEIEHRCAAKGDACCEWEIKPWDAWGPEADPWKQSLMATSESIYQDLLASNKKISDLNQNLEKEVERRTEENRRLLRMICHDLVVPMQAMKKSMTLLQLGASIQDVKFAHETLVKCIDTIQIMLEQVRDEEALSSGKMALKAEAFSLDEALSTIKMMVHGLLASKNINFHIENELGPNDLLWVPPTTFTSNILSNVLSNAIKFSPRDGSIFLNARVEGEEIKITVRDEGIGIPARLRPHLFSMQQPTSRIGTAGERGTGFGLPIVKSYLDLIGGRMEIESRSREEDAIHHGTTVVLFLPKAGASSQAPKT